MSNYLHQIAGRNSITDQSLLMPAYSPGEARLNDPFDNVSAVTDKTESTEAATEIKKPSAANTVIEPVQPAKEQARKEAVQPVPVKPIYLSKYRDRNNEHISQPTHRVITKVEDKSKTATVENKLPVLSNFQNEKITPAAKPVTIAEHVEPIQPQQPVTSDIAPTQKSILPKATTDNAEQPVSIMPAANAKQPDNNPVMLQPQPPFPTTETLQKEKPVPALVIGKLTVEIVPAQKPVNKIINHIVKPQTTASAPAPRSKFSFGLGQL